MLTVQETVSRKVQVPVLRECGAGPELAACLEVKCSQTIVLMRVRKNLLAFSSSARQTGNSAIDRPHSDLGCRLLHLDREGTRLRGGRVTVAFDPIVLSKDGVREDRDLSSEMRSRLEAVPQEDQRGCRGKAAYLMRCYAHTKLRPSVNKGLKRFFESGDLRGVPAQHGARIRRQLDVLDAARDVMDMNLTGWKLHQLKGTYG
jgi:hypothetical protein